MFSSQALDGSPAAYRTGVERLATAVEAAVRPEPNWSGRLSAGVRAALDALAADPPLARLLLIEPLAASGPLRLEYEQSRARLARALRPPGELAVAPEIAEERTRLLAAGLVSFLSGRVIAGEAADLPASRDLLTDYLLVGTDAMSRCTDERSA